MARYIDADLLIKTIRDNDYLVVDYFNSKDRGMFTTGIMQAIDEQPTADVRENVRGFWYALEKGDKGYSAGDFKCSICGEPNHTWIPKPNFCPNCGALMKGDKA